MDHLETLSFEILRMSSNTKTAEAGGLPNSSSTTNIMNKSCSGASLASSQTTQRTKCSSGFSSTADSVRGCTLSSTTQTPGAFGSSVGESDADASSVPSEEGSSSPPLNPATRGGGKTVLEGIAPSMQGMLRRRARFSGWKTEPVYFELRSTALLAFSSCGAGSKGGSSGVAFGSSHGQVHNTGSTGVGSLATLAAKILHHQQRQVGDWSWSMDLAGAEKVIAMPTASKRDIFAFSVEFPNGSKKKPLMLGANSLESRDRWIKALDQARHCVQPQDFHPLAVIGEGHFGKVLLVRWNNSAAAVRDVSPYSTSLSSTPTTMTPRLVEEGDEADGEDEGRSRCTKSTQVRDNGNRLLAVKEVALQKKTSLPGVLNERQILGVLREHPFVITLRCAWRRGNFLYYGLDFLPGADLFELFRRNSIKMDLKASRFYGGQIALALEHLHAHGICYRDLKPENILVDAKGYLRLADMGLSKILGTGPDALRTTTVCGTRAYLAPEMIRRKPYGLSVDFWQFGCFVYELYAGHSPFWTPRSGPPGRANDQTVALILAGEIHYSRSICPVAKTFIRDLLNPEVDSRLGCCRVPPRSNSLTSAATDASAGRAPVDAIPPAPQPQQEQEIERPKQHEIGWKSVKQHAFFDGMDWEALLRGELSAPLKPGALGRGKVANFAREYTRQRAGWGGDHPELRDSGDKEALFRRELMGFDFLRL